MTAGTPSAPLDGPVQPTPGVTGLPGLDVGAAANAAYAVVDYGDALARNKDMMLQAAQTAGANAQELAVIVAMGMQESTLMDVGQRDRSKDGTPSANVTALNMNLDMLQQVGYRGDDDGARLNDPENLGEALGLLLAAFHAWGIERTLDFQRGGRAAFGDGQSYGAYDYRNAIATMYALIGGDGHLLWDGRRIEISLDHV